MGHIKIEIYKEVGINGGVWLYSSMPTSINIVEAQKYARAFRDAIEVATRWQYGNQFAEAREQAAAPAEPAKKRGRPAKAVSG